MIFTFTMGEDPTQIPWKEENLFHIYKITNLINNKIYIGQTNNPRQRYYQYKHAATKQNLDDPKNKPCVVARAMKKHGVENFVFELITTATTQEEVSALEIKFIAELNSRDGNVGYNVAEGGRDLIMTDDIIAKIVASRKEYFKTHDGPNKGKKLSAEIKQNMSKAAMGKLGTNTGKEFDQEWRKKISDSNKNKQVKSRHRFSDDIEKEICKKYADGASTYRLGIDYDCNRTLISDILKRHNVPQRQNNYTGHDNGCRKFTDEQELEMCDLYQIHNNTRHELAKKFKCGSTTVREILIRRLGKL